MATVRMSDGLKDIMFRQMRKINPPKDQKNMPQSWADAAYKIWLTTEQGELVCEMAQRKLAREMFLKEVARIRVSSVNGETLWGTVGGNSTDKFYVPKDSGYTEFSIRLDHCAEANWIAEAIRAHQAENKAISAENQRVEKEIMAMLNCAPTLNGVLKKYPFLRELVPAHVQSKLAEKVKRTKKEEEPEVLDEDALAIQRRLKIGIIANKVSGE